LVAVFLYNASRKRRVQCNKCGTLFSIHARLSKLSLTFFWMLIGPAVIFVVVSLLLVLKSFFSH